MKVLEAIPALPVRDLDKSAAFYRDMLGFSVLHQEDVLVVLGLEQIQVHLWLANDERWRTEEHWNPVVSGAETFIAGTASCRIGLDGVDEMHERLAPAGIIHPKAPIEDKPWGTREFSVLDPDKNLITYYQWKR